MFADYFAYEPAELVPPGETLDEWLERNGMTQAELARRTRLTPKHINQVVKGSASISPDVALAFERVTAIPARYWTQLEANYQAALKRAEEARALQRHLDLVGRFPIRVLERRGAITRQRSKVDQLRELLRFFKVADVEALQEVWLQPALYRLSAAFQVDEAALASWLRLAEIEASQVKTQPFDLAACRAAIEPMRSLSRRPGAEWLEPLKALCATVGIALVVVKELPRCRANGATRWLTPDKAMIVLSLRHHRNDIAWFTFFHELCHIIRHGKKDTFVDAGGDGSELEAEADTFASRVLIPPHLVGRLRTLTTADEVIAFAEEIGVAPGIVVGRMRHDELIPHNQWSYLIESV